MSDRTDNIAQMIEVYTQQIERYENLSTWYAAFVVVCVLAIIAMAIFLILNRKKQDNGSREIYNASLSGIFLLIPSITTLYLYVFSMNMRKVALYRGYLAFLEEQWNSLEGLEIMLFDGEIIKRFFPIQNFLVNGLGPVVMAVFIILSLIIGFGLSIYFEKQLKASKIKKSLQLLLGILIIVCVLFDGICTYYLTNNDYTTDAVVNYCEKAVSCK